MASVAGAAITGVFQNFGFAETPPSPKLYTYDSLLMSFGPGPHGPVSGNNGHWSAELMLPRTQSETSAVFALGDAIHTVSR